MTILTSTPIRRLLPFALCLALAACAAVHHVPAGFQPRPVAAQPAPRMLGQAAQITLDTGYTRALKPGSLWRDVGSLAQGEVYRPVQDVFTLEGANIHEAYLVVRDDTLVGFYLPAEQGFSPLQATVHLHFNN